MTGKDYFTPFVEAKADTPGIVLAVSGTDTSEIDSLRQGVEIQNAKQRYAGILPKFGSGEDNNELDILTIGQAKEFRPVVPFEEVNKFDPVVYITSSGSLNFPNILNNASLIDPERFGAFIEPLTIGARNELLLTSEFDAHTVKGHLMGGNEDTFNKCDVISHIYAVNPPINIHDLYIDATSLMGSSSNGSILLTGYFPESEKRVIPFNETKNLSKNVISGAIDAVNSTAINNALLAMTGASTDEYITEGYKSSGTGFTFGNSVYGTDSIAFGGLKR
jgi:hypothetical protein